MPDAPAIAIIPARIASQRFPGKVLARDTGKPLIQHVWEAATRSAAAPRVIVATDDVTVEAACRGFGAECVMTRADHPNGSSRLAEACALLAVPPDTIVVNVQGDEPEMDPALIDAVVGELRAGHAEVSTIASPFAPRDDPSNPNIVKVVLARDGRAMYFSRALIPHVRDGSADAVAPLRHVGLYAYRRRMLDQYLQLAETPLELAEKLEQLRWLEHGIGIAVAVREAHHASIDTPEQYAAFVARHRAAMGTMPPAPR